VGVHVCVIVCHIMCTGSEILRPDFDLGKVCVIFETKEVHCYF
jgi:hypothetical protein